MPALLASPVDNATRRQPVTRHPGHTMALRQLDKPPRSSDNLAETFAVAPAQNPC